jgi:hypothetical protein
MLAIREEGGRLHGVFMGMTQKLLTGDLEVSQYEVIMSHPPPTLRQATSRSVSQSAHTAQSQPTNTCAKVIMSHPATHTYVKVIFNPPTTAPHDL